MAFATGSYNVPGWDPALGIYVHRDNPLRQLTLQQPTASSVPAHRRLRPELRLAAGVRARAGEEHPHLGQLGSPGRADKPINAYGLNLKYHQQYLIEQRAFRGGSNGTRLREYAHYLADGSNVVANVQLLEDVSNDC